MKVCGGEREVREGIINANVIVTAVVVIIIVVIITNTTITTIIIVVVIIIVLILVLIIALISSILLLLLIIIIIIIIIVLILVLIIALILILILIIITITINITITIIIIIIIIIITITITITIILNIILILITMIAANNRLTKSGSAAAQKTRDAPRPSTRPLTSEEDVKAGFDPVAVLVLPGGDLPAEDVPGLVDDGLVAGIHEVAGGREPRQASADDGDGLGLALALEGRKLLRERLGVPVVVRVGDLLGLRVVLGLDPQGPAAPDDGEGGGGGGGGGQGRGEWGEGSSCGNSHAVMDPYAAVSVDGDPPSLQ